MTGEIFDIPIQGYHHNDPHPHVVVVELDKECWVVPAFGSEGVEIDMWLDDFCLAGYPRGLCYVEMDNSEHVHWADGRSGKQAKWVIARARKLAKGQFRHRQPSGHMGVAGLSQIVENWIELAECVDHYSPHLKKRLRQLSQDLQNGGVV